MACALAALAGSLALAFSTTLVMAGPLPGRSGAGPRVASLATSVGATVAGVVCGVTTRTSLPGRGAGMLTVATAGGTGLISAARTGGMAGMGSNCGRTADGGGAVWMRMLAFAAAAAGGGAPLSGRGGSGCAALICDDGATMRAPELGVAIPVLACDGVTSTAGGGGFSTSLRAAAIAAVSDGRRVSATGTPCPAARLALTASPMARSAGDRLASMLPSALVAWPSPCAEARCR